MIKKVLLSTVLFAVACFCFGQQQRNEPPAVSITSPINGSIVEGEQIRVSYFISVSAPATVRVSVDGRAVQLITDARLGENTAVVDIPDRDCRITIVAQNAFGASVPVTVNLVRSEHIFKPSLYYLFA